MVRRYKQHHEAILAPAHREKEILPFSEKFNRQAMDALLAKPGCVAIRIYYGMDEALKVHAILVGVDAGNKDILPVFTHPERSGDDATDDIAQRGMRCPPICPEDEGINGGD